MPESRTSGTPLQLATINPLFTDKKLQMPTQMSIVAIDKIKVGLNRRPLNTGKVEELMESIKANGLLNPITVDQDLNLIAGLHRLTACDKLGLDQIECKIITCDARQARLAEIDENLIRSELDTLERAQLWLERDQILEEMGLRAKAGDNQYKKKGDESISPPLKTTLELAKEVGYTKRTFQQGKQIAKSIAPEVKKAIKGTPIAKSTTALLKVARAGSEERKKAEKAEKALQEAKRQQQQQEADRQAKLAAEARAKQQELQLIALYSEARQKAKTSREEAQAKVPQQEEGKSKTSVGVPMIKLGDEWILNKHFVFSGDTSSGEFKRRLPSDAALAIATPGDIWNHDYLEREARVVAVLRSEGDIHNFCCGHKMHMPLRFELILGDLYVALFSHQSISRPHRQITVGGVEGVVTYLMNLYTSPGNFVIAPFVGKDGEVLIACEKMGRICFAGDENPQLVSRAIARWQNWTGKPARRML